jgi:hypothetical protein
MSLAEDLLIKSKLFRGSVFSTLFLLSSISVVITMTEFVDSKQQRSYIERFFNAPSNLASVNHADMERISAQLNSVKDELNSVKASAITVPVSIDVNRLEERIEGVANRLTLLESAISSNPEKALAVPMLRKDHETLVKQFNDSLISSKLDYDRLWGMLMLFLSSLGAAVVVVSGWALKSVFSKGEPKPLGNGLPSSP